jgi:hypothetical protein
MRYQYTFTHGDREPTPEIHGVTGGWRFDIKARLCCERHKCPITVWRRKDSNSAWSKHRTLTPKTGRETVAERLNRETDAY